MRATSTQIIRSRRNRLTSSLGDIALVFYSGEIVARNIPDVTYPYRCNSHVLYYFGWLPEKSICLLTANEAIVFKPENQLHGELWHGPTESEMALRKRCDLDEVFSLEDFDAQLERIDKPVASLTGSLFGHSNRKLDQELCNEFIDQVIEERLVCDSFGLEQLELASKLSADVFNLSFQQISQSETERSLAAYLEYQTAIRGATLAYPAIVTSSPYVLHATPRDVSLSQAEMILIDYGAEIESGYCSDCTRVLPVVGARNEVKYELSWSLYEMLLGVQKECIEKLRPSVRYLEIQELAEHLIIEGLLSLGILSGSLQELIERSVASYFFPHGVGHPIGLDVHDLGDLGDRVGYPDKRSRSTEFGRCFLRFDRDVQAGMALTVEPGCYFAPALMKKLELDYPHLINAKRLSSFNSFGGIRIEDTAYVGKTKTISLTNDVLKERKDLEPICVGIADRLGKNT